MLRTPWICSRCLALRWKQTRRLQWRLNSTVAQPGVVYPALLARAKNIASEHKVLSEKLNESYDNTAAKRVGELASIVDALNRYQKADESLNELRTLIRDPSTDEELRALAAEDLETTAAQLDEASQALTKSLVPKHPFADLPCFIEVRPGAGGGEASIFAKDLLEMYQGYCSERSMRTSLVQKDVDDQTGGITGAMLEVETPGAYGVLRCEAGVHRVQRVPATETKGRTHTSSASVMVLPSIPSQIEETASSFDDPNSDYYIDPKDIRTDVLKASGAGGQHVNKTESAIRLTHIPTNTVVSMQDSRSQHENREKAWTVMRSRLAQARREAREEELKQMRRSVVGVAKMGRGDKIRTYNWSQQRITDHRSGTTVHGIDGVLSGGQNLEKLMEEVRKWMAEREVEDMIASAETAET
ncbi:release factor [Venturia nashicola]|nr:release factor [Venturia nashicola]